MTHKTCKMSKLLIEVRIVQKKMFENLDDYDFNPSTSSKLASLFDNTIPTDDLGSSLTYRAPKQPKAEKELDISEPAKKVQTSLLLAEVVTLWKLENKEYQILGKHGLAIIGSQDLNLFEIIVYKEKNNVLLRRKISDKCSFFNQKDGFSSFYDNNNLNWLVKFESPTHQARFCKEIQNYGAVIKTSEKASQNKERISSDTNSTDSLLTNPDISPKPLPRTERVADDVHSDSSGSQKRANILSRMAKMGQQILPNEIKNTSTDISDSEVDDSNIHKVPPRKFKRTVHVEKSITPKEEAIERQRFLESQLVPSQSNNLNYSTQFPPVAYNQPAVYDSGFSHYIAVQNTELKMNLAQISAKLDGVLSGNNVSDRFDDRAYKSKIRALQLQSENLQTELQKYEERYCTLQKKYDDLQKKVNPMEQAENKAVIQKLTQEIEKLKLYLNAAEEQNSNHAKLEDELELYKSDIKEYEKTIEIQKLKLKDFEEFYEENKDNKNLLSTIEGLNDTVSTLKLKLKDFEEYFQKTEEDKRRRTEGNSTTINLFSNKIKDNMNNMYQSILDNFSEGTSYSVLELKSVVAQNLKATTFRTIEDFKNIHKNEDASTSGDSQTK